MANSARRSSALAIRLLLLLLSICRCVNDEVKRQGSTVADGSNINDDDEMTITFLHCSSTTIFGLVTVDCTAHNISSVKQLRLDRHDDLRMLQLADNRLARLGPDEFGRVVPHLQQLYLTRNFIDDVDEHAFRNLRTLQVGVLLL